MVVVVRPSAGWMPGDRRLDLLTATENPKTLLRFGTEFLVIHWNGLPPPPHPTPHFLIIIDNTNYHQHLDKAKTCPSLRE